MKRQITERVDLFMVQWLLTLICVIFARH